MAGHSCKPEIRPDEDLSQESLVELVKVAWVHCGLRHASPEEVRVYHYPRHQEVHRIPFFCNRVV